MNTIVVREPQRVEKVKKRETERVYKYMKRLFLTSSVNFVAGDIVKKLGSEVRGKNLVFINTAAEPEEGDKQWLIDDRQSLVDAGFKVTDYTFTDKSKEQVRQDLQKFDVIFVSGGNTFYLLEKIQQSGAAEIIRNFVDNGKVYIGSSAGTVIAGPDIYPSYNLDDASKAAGIKGYEGLGLTDIVVLPHWGSEYFRELYLNKRLEHAYTVKHKIILLTDYQYVEVKDDWCRIGEVKHK